MAKEFFQEHGVQYAEKNVGQDQKAAEEMIEKSGQMGVPVTVIADGGKDTLVIGFDRPRLASALGISS
jgi:glutaredoxin 3